jgi:hypothetical protein
MKTIFFPALAAAALTFAPAALSAVDELTLQGIKNDRELQQELNGSPGFGPLERSSQGTLFGRGFQVEPLGELAPPDGSERLLENSDRFSLQSGVKPESPALPPSRTLSTEKPAEPAFPPDDSEDFQD